MGRQVLVVRVGPPGGTHREAGVSPLGSNLSVVHLGFVLRPVGTSRQWSVVPLGLSGRKLDVIGRKPAVQCDRIGGGGGV